ncbi:MAG: phospholipid carrier-dependent glycosyltransferase [Gemmatimonadetes bacterium]|nr:phospholipid carrier-dependent glycosyltransferase [Gemmatimonadota bacterium]
MAKKSKKPAAAPVAVATPAPGRRLPIWGLAVVLVQLGLMLTVFNPAAHNGGDTAGYVTLAHSLLDRGTYQDLWQPGQPPHTKYPPVFPALLAAAIVLGARTWAALKVVPALFTTLSVLLAYLWARERRGAPFAAAVALLTAVSSAVLWSSHWELSEPPFMALTFLSLWAFDRALPADRAAAPVPARAPERTVAWLTVGTLAAGLAYFTRSAGLPLLAAAGICLLLHRRYRTAAALAVGVGGLAVLWSMRGGQGAQYVSEFWMIDPYQPDLGRVGVGGLIARVLDNAKLYVLAYVPTGLTGLRGPLTAPIGLALFGMAGWGWFRCAWPRPGVAELFVPMYLGLILLWPAVWSGDRFALPLLPPLLFYAGEALLHLMRNADVTMRRVVVGMAIALFAVPSLSSWGSERRTASGCKALVQTDGAFSCSGTRTYEFVEAAVWGGSHLPEGAVVLTRKPRIWYVESGLPSETFPFTKDVARFLAFADSVGARYVVMDYLDSAASVYVAQALLSQGGAFCALKEFAHGDEVPTQILGIMPPENRPKAEVQESDDGTLTVAMRRCPPEMTRPDPLPEQSPKTEQIPLLVGFAR